MRKLPSPSIGIFAPSEFVIPAGIVIQPTDQITEYPGEGLEGISNFLMYEVVIRGVPLIPDGGFRRILALRTNLQACDEDSNWRGCSIFFYQKSYDATLDERVLQVFFNVTCWDNLDGVIQTLTTNNDESFYQFQLGEHVARTKIIGLPINQPRSEKGSSILVEAQIPTPTPRELPT